MDILFHLQLDNIPMFKHYAAIYFFIYNHINPEELFIFSSIK